MTIKPNRLDSRQVEYRGLLDQLSNGSGVSTTELDNLLSSINAETTPLLRIVPSSPASRVFAVEAPSVYNPETGRKRSIPPINGLIPNFTTALIRIPLYPSDSQTPQPIEVAYAGGEWSALNPIYLNPNKYIKIGLNLDPLGKILLTFGNEGSTPETASAAPAISNTYTIGYVLAHSTNGVIDSIDAASVFQYVGNSGGDGTGTANILVETLKNQLVDSPYDLLTDNIVYIDAAKKFSSIVGAEYDLVTTTLKYTAPGQTSTSVNLADPLEFIDQGLDIDSADLTVFWNTGSLVQSFQTPLSETKLGLSATTAIGSSSVTVNYPSHGLVSGDLACIKTTSDIGGVSASGLSFDTVSITVVDQNTLVFEAGSQASQTTTGYLDYFITGFAYLASRDGRNYFPVTMKRLGQSEVYYGNIAFGQRTTFETFTTPLYSISASTGTVSRRILATGGNNKIAQTFTVPEGTSYVLDSAVFQSQINGTPAGLLYASIVKDSDGLPSNYIGDSLAESLPIGAATASGAVTFKFTRTVLKSGNYHLVIRSDVGYQSGSGYVSLLEHTKGGESVFNEASLWTVSGSSKNIDMALYGRALDLRVKIISLTQNSYPFGLDGYGIFYSQQNSGLFTGSKKLQKVAFSGADNLSIFEITAFSPDPDMLTCYHVETGKVYRVPGFQIQGTRVVFPADFFATDPSNSVTLIFDQNSGGSYDNSNANALLLANNHFGSQDPLLDRSAAGRGFLLRRNDNALREFTIDNDDNIRMYDSDGNNVAVLGSMGRAFATPTNPGLVSTVTQTIGGEKTFNDATTFLASAGSVVAGLYDQTGQWTFNGPVLFSSPTISLGGPSTSVTVGSLQSQGLVHVNSSGLLSASLLANADIASNANITDDKLSTISTPGKVSNSATTADSSNTPNSIVSRNSSGGFSAAVITATDIHTANLNTTGNTLLGDTSTDGLEIRSQAVTIPNGLNFASDSLVVDSTNKRVGVNVATPTSTLDLGGTLAVSGVVTLSNDLNMTGTGYAKVPAGTDLQRPAVPSNGMIRYNSSSSSFEGYSSGAWSAIGGGGTIDRITQDNSAAGTNFGAFSLGDTLYINNNIYTKAIATSASAAEVVGVVSRIVDSNLSTFTFEMTLSGEISGLTGITPGAVYFLSDTVPGALTKNEPSTIGNISIPVGVGASSTSIYVAPKRGLVVGGANLRTQISLSGGASSPVQNVSTYDAGKLAGWISLTGTSSAKFYFEVAFAKNSTGTDYNVSPSYMGDTPPAGFSIQYTSPNISCTVPSGYIAVVNYSLNAPAVGTNYPITLDVTSVNNIFNSVSGPTTLTSANYYVSATGSASYTITLPSAVGLTGRLFIVKSNLSAGQILTLTTSSSQTIDGLTSQLIGRYSALHVISNGANWEIL
ncbi:hypothetical protein UFOVP244_165 [uncultured Caudovirales phage]|uniref:Uncharacterized protein n=1 Tax=uncultured Caudovirales phage TaxID=2100421 RepID=A0A6J7WUJ0_9CAUD|nr:hypothetical protein UFOVP244_165 [uncultured Caudovirales phage]